MKTGKDKLHFLLSRISDKRVLTPLEQSIQIHPINDFDNEFPGNELKIILTKLMDEELLPMNMTNFIQNLETRFKKSTIN